MKAHSELFERAIALPAAREVRRPCLACNRPYARSIDADHRFCPTCAGDLPTIAEVLRRELAALEARLAALHDRWLTYLAGQPDDLAARWTALVQTRDIAQTQYERARTCDYPASLSDDDRRRCIRHAADHVQAVQAKIARTRQHVPELVALLDAEAAYRARVRALESDRATKDVILQEIDHAESTTKQHVGRRASDA